MSNRSVLVKSVFDFGGYGFPSLFGDIATDYASNTIQLDFWLSDASSKRKHAVTFYNGSNPYRPILDDVETLFDVIRAHIIMGKIDANLDTFKLEGLDGDRWASVRDWYIIAHYVGQWFNSGPDNWNIHTLDVFNKGGFTSPTPIERYVYSLSGYESVTGLRVDENGELAYSCLDSIANAVRAYLVNPRNVVALRQPQHYFGAWVESGSLYLDVSFCTDSLSVAILGGVANRQLAIWDRHANKSIYIVDIVESLLTEKQFHALSMYCLPEHDNEQG